MFVVGWETQDGIWIGSEQDRCGFEPDNPESIDGGIPQMKTDSKGSLGHSRRQVLLPVLFHFHQRSVLGDGLAVGS